MLTALWRSALILTAVVTASGAPSTFTDTSGKSPFWSNMLMAGGWIMIGFLAMGSIAILTGGVWPPIRHIIGQDPHPPRDA